MLVIATKKLGSCYFNFKNVQIVTKYDKINISYIHLKTFVLDEFLDPVDNIKLTIFIEVSKVSSMHPSMFINSLLGGFWIVEITCK